MSELPLNVKELNTETLKENGVALSDKYLPISGGILSGDTITRDVDNSRLIICGATDINKGAYLELLGNVNFSNDSKFNIGVRKDIGSNARLHGEINGNLTWFGNDLASSAIVAKSLNQNGYVKYASGLIIVWGHYWSNNTNNTRVSFPIAFTNGNSISISCDTVDYDVVSNVSVYRLLNDVTGFKIKHNLNNESVSIHWHAIGY